MRLTLHHKRVVTESGTALGRVRDVEVVWPELRIVVLQVHQGTVPLMGREYDIDPADVVRVEDDMLVVRDAVLRELEAERLDEEAATAGSVIPGVGPVLGKPAADLAVKLVTKKL